MRQRLACRISALLLALSMIGSSYQSVEEYAKLMKPAAAANAKLQKTIAADLSAAATAAADVKSAFLPIEQFWAKHGVADAQAFAKNIQQLADEVQTAAKAGNKEQAAAAAKNIGTQCAGCHNAHREKTPEGWKIK